MLGLQQRICQLLQPASSELLQLAQYQFQVAGKAVRPTLAILMARVCNHYPSGSKPRAVIKLQDSQCTVALVSEMIHAASLVHDDLLDSSALRRGRPSLQAAFGHRQAVFSGDFMLGVASKTLARLRQPQVVSILSQVIEDLVLGEIQQLASHKDHFGEQEMLQRYLRRCYLKTASLMANSCRAVSVLSAAAGATDEPAFQFGRHLGLLFQITDDLLDFEGSTAALGKPANAADLRQGLATAPVILATRAGGVDVRPRLRQLMLRRFARPGDAEAALSLVMASDGLARSRALAESHAASAQQQLLALPACAERDALATLLKRVSQRTH